MKRRHDMPFGAEYRADGSVRFRLWAPAARGVDLCLEPENGTRYIPLEKSGNGWFELVTDAAPVGTLYRYRIDEGTVVPDPASRFQPEDVHAPSEVIDPDAFNWRDDDWHGRRWEEAVIYELHIGAFTPQGTFSAARERLDYLADLGITAIELMPVADFPGKRNWGYDGVLQFAPDSSYGRPEELKELVQSAHARGIMVFLDVVYNHFGPEGNYLNCYAPQFFTDRHHTPWGNGINFDGPDSRTVRDFFIDNALYWLNEYHFDGLRLDAVHAIVDDSAPDILTELAETIRNRIAPERQIHLVLENDRNESHFLQRNHNSDQQTRDQRHNVRCRPRTYTAQWNDDIHHVLHVLIAGESDGYYADYSGHPLDQLGRCLTQGFAYQGESSQHRNGDARGESTEGLPPAAFVSFLQNHDQIGNRAFGERITSLADPRAIQAAAAILMLAPFPPMLFMGEEFGAETPFLFFCDFEKDLAKAVTEGRRNEFVRFARFNDPSVRERIPDPSAASTFQSSRLNWSVVEQPRHQEWLRFYRDLLKLRRAHVVPLLAGACKLQAEYRVHGNRGLSARWKFPEQPGLTLLANLGTAPLSDLPFASSFASSASSRVLYASDGITAETLKIGGLPAWSVVWMLES